MSLPVVLSNHHVCHIAQILARMLCQTTLVVSKRKQYYYYSNGLFYGRLLVTGRQSTGGLISGDSIRGKQQYKSLTWYANYYYNLALLLFQDDTNILFE